MSDRSFLPLSSSLLAYSAAMDPEDIDIVDITTEPTSNSNRSAASLIARYIGASPHTNSLMSASTIELQIRADDILDSTTLDFWRDDGFVVDEIIPSNTRSSRRQTITLRIQFPDITVPFRSVTRVVNFEYRSFFLANGRLYELFNPKAFFDSYQIFNMLSQDTARNDFVGLSKLYAPVTILRSRSMGINTVFTDLFDISAGVMPGANNQSCIRVRNMVDPRLNVSEWVCVPLSSVEERSIDDFTRNQ